MWRVIAVYIFGAIWKEGNFNFVTITWHAYWEPLFALFIARENGARRKQGTLCPSEVGLSALGKQ